MDCCNKKSEKKKKRGFLTGLVYGLIPHIGCIAFIVFTVLGVTTATAFFKPFLLNPYFFYILVAMSIIFATISAFFYLKKNKILSFQGMKNKRKYLLILYGTTISVNLILFIVVFPIAANINLKASVGNEVIKSQNSLSSITLEVSIPCPGHAPLITGELKNIIGVINVIFKFPNKFELIYDSAKTSEEQILSLDVFKTYKATVKK